VGTPGYDIAFDTWSKAGHGVSGAADTLASEVDSLCGSLAAAGMPWGSDEIGQAFFNGAEGTPGFGVVRDSLLSGLADTVNLLRATGGTLVVSGRNYRLAEDASTVGGSLPEGADKDALAEQHPYSLPPVAGGLAHSDPPPSVVRQMAGFLAKLVGGCDWPDGDMAGLASVKAAFDQAAKSVLGVAQDVDGHALTVTANNAGEAVERFGSFAAALRGGGEEGGLLWLAGMCAALADSVDFLIRQKNAARLQLELSCGFLVVTWMAAWAISWITGGSSIAAAEAVTVTEGFAVKTFFLQIAKAVGAGVWFAGGMDGAAQFARIHEGLQKDFDGGEFLGALGEGAIAGAVMGGAGAGIAARNTRLTTALADWMGADGAKGVLSRLAFAGTTGTLGNVAAQGLVEHHVDLAQAAQFGFGMAGLGAAGEVGKHYFGATMAGPHSEVPASADASAPAPTAEHVSPSTPPAVPEFRTETPSHESGGMPGETGPADTGSTALAGHENPVPRADGQDAGSRTADPGGGQSRIGAIINQPTGRTPTVDVSTEGAPGAYTTVVDATPRPAMSAESVRTGVPVEGRVASSDAPPPPAAKPGPDGTARTGSADRPAVEDGPPPAASSDHAASARSGEGSTLAAEDPARTPAASAPEHVAVGGAPLDQNGRAPATPGPGEPSRAPDPVGLAAVPSPVDGGAGVHPAGAPHAGDAPMPAAPRPGHTDGTVPADTRPGFDLGGTARTAREVHALRSADLNPDTRPPLVPAYGERALATLRGEYANTLTEGEALHASQWTDLRESATAEPITRVHHPFENASQIELRRLGVTAPDRTVSEYTVKVRYQADPAMAPHDVVRAQSHVLDAVDPYYNHQHRLQDGSQLHVRMEFEEAPASAASDVVQLRQGDGTQPGERPDMLTWYADMDPVTVAHEVGHHLDLHDEYVDPQRAGAETLTAPGVTRDAGLMGSGRRFWADHTPVVDHNGHAVPDTAGLRDRHLAELHELGEHTAPEARGDAGPRVPGEHWTPRHEDAPLELPDHVRDLLGRRDEDGQPVFPPEGRDPLEHAMLLDRTHALFRDEVRPDRLTNDHARYTEALTDAAHRLYETAPEYSFRETDLRGLRRLADTVGASPDGALPHADLLHEVARQTLGRNPTPRDVEALTRLAEHLNDQMSGRHPFELPSDALHRAAADRLGGTPGSVTTRRAVDRFAEVQPHLPSPAGEHPVPRADDYMRQKRARIDAANAAMREYEQKYGRLTPEGKHELRQQINEHLNAQEKSDDPRRPKYRQETRRLILERAKRDKDGNILDANSGKPIKEGELHIGHTPKNEWRKIKADAKRLDLTGPQINTVVQNPNIYQTEKGPGKDGNSSHAHEDKSKSPSDLLRNAKKLPDGSIVVNGVRVYPDGRTVDAQTKKPIKQREVPTAWKMPTPAELKKVERGEQKQAEQRQDWIEEVQDKSNLTRKEKDALEQVKKANELRAKADKSYFFNSSKQEAERKAAAAEQEAREKVDKARKKWWQ
jgi:hypothetical protein